MPKKTIAITGINGFPGQALLRWLDYVLGGETADDPESLQLREKYQGVVAIDISPPKGKFVATKFYRVDLTDPSADQKLAEIFAQENVATLFHMAFKINPNREASDSHELHSIGTMYLLNACAQQRMEKIVMHSSTYCYGAYPDNPNFLTEKHPLRGGRSASYVRDRIDIEKQMSDYQKQQPDCVVTILRTCSILGPTVYNFATRYLSRKICLTPLGFDPLIQLVHEEDVLRSFQLALLKNARGAFNVVGKGVLPLLTVLRLSGRTALPVATPLLYPLVSAMWQTNMAIVPPGYVDYLRYNWVADGERASHDLEFTPRYTTRETILSFAGMARLKQVGLD